MSRNDWILNEGDILFMDRGARNFSIMLQAIPKNLLAAACFFIVRVDRKEVVPAYLCWYLNQAPVEHYLHRYSGRGVHMPVVRRSTLEKTDIPVPTLEIQKKIIGMNALMKNEQELIEKLAEKRRALITAACLQTVRNS
jgi:restriction endonuclease S subunit